MANDSRPIVQAPALRRYQDLLLEANAALNLTAVRDPDAVERRHIAESLALVRVLEQEGYLPAGARVIDVGSGGGLPGMPLAIVRADITVTLLEATGKKAVFLDRVAREMELANVRVIAARAEEAAHDPAQREQYDIAVARAVAPLVTLVELTLAFVRVGGLLAAVKGSRAEQEIADASLAVARCGGATPRLLPLAADAPNLRLVLVPKVYSTPPQLPRRTGIPTKRPLR